MDHLDVVTSTLITDPLAAGLTVALGGDGLEDVLDEGPRLLVATGHERGAISSTLLTTGDTRADEADALGSKVSCPAVGVWEVRVAAINDNVTALKEREKALNPVVNSLSGLDEKHDSTGLLELGDELLGGVGADNWLALGLVREEAVDLGDGSVEGADSEAMVGHVQNQVLTPIHKVLELKNGEKRVSRPAFGRRRPVIEFQKEDHLHDGKANKAEISAFQRVSIDRSTS